MINGLCYAGIGVSDIDSSLKFYRDFLGFKDVVFDYTGTLPGMERVTGKRDLKARSVMLASENVSPVATGMIELVQVLPPHAPNRSRVDYEWGDIRIAEACMNVHNIEEVYRMATVEKGFKAVLEPNYLLLDGEEFKYAYFRDPEGILIEFIEFHMYKEFGGKPKIEAMNHIGFGVRDMDQSMTFYADALGFDIDIWDSTSNMQQMASMLPSPTPRMRVKCITNSYRGGYLEPFQHLPPYEPRLAGVQWGDIGHMEFGINVSNIDKVYDQLQKKGVKFLCPPQTVDLPPSGQWKYAYMEEPNGLIVALVEH